MKKLVLTVAVMGFAASMASAQEPVYSQNIVGYAKKDLAAGVFEIVSPQFLVGEDDGGVVLSNAFTGLNESSVVFVWSGSGYSEYTYYGEYGWFDSGSAPAGDVLIGQGDAVWLKDSGDGATAVMAGEVPSASSITNTVSAGFSLIANPYPVSMTLDEIPVASLAEGDVVFVWNGAAYSEYTYYGEYGWFDSGSAPAGSVSIDVGQGFWINSAAGGDLVFTKAF